MAARGFGAPAEREKASLAPEPTSREDPVQAASLPPQPKRASTILSIGHSNQSFEKFRDMLEMNNVQVVIDTRSQPYSKHTPHFSRENLEQELHRAGFGYVFLGNDLGGRPPGPEFYDADGHVLYWKIAEAPFFRHGLEKLMTWRKRYNVVLMCSEENPAGCHRRLLIGRVLFDQGFEVVHLRASGVRQSESSLRKEESSAPPRQIRLGEDPEAGTWKSIRSVSPRSPHGNSSPR